MPFIPHTPDDIAHMLAVIGAPSIDELFDEIPAALKAKPLDGVPPALCEMDVARLVTERAAGDGRLLNFIGAGAYEHHIPAPVWAIATRGEFYSAYTPYQAEASQGTLQLIYEFQSMICALTGMEAANASLYDGASALAEACLMAVRANRGSTSRRILMPRTVNPTTARSSSRSPAIRSRVRERGLRSRLGATVARGATASQRRGYRGAGGAAAEFLRQPRGGRRAHGLGAHEPSVADRGGQSHLARLVEAPGRVGRRARAALGRRHRVRRRPAARRAARFRRSLLRLHGDTHALRAADAGAHRGTHARCGRTSGVRTDLAGTRATHPAQQSHLQHLHQSGPHGDRGDHLHVAPGRRGARAASPRRAFSAPPSCCMRCCGSAG